MHGNGEQCDVTSGQRIPTAEMTAAQRSAQMDATVRHLNDVTRSVNNLIAEARALRVLMADARRDSEEVEVRSAQRDDAVGERQNMFYAKHQAFISRSFTARLRWLFTGR